jgi:two-component system CitB family sensor kinase
VVMYNDQAAELLGLAPRTADAGSTGGARQAAPSLAELPLAASLKELFESGRTAHDEIHLTDSRILVANQGPAVGPGSPAERARGAVFGTVATIRDRTEIESLGSELETMRTLSDALRAQTHEHANRLHTIVSLMELGRGTEALDFATQDLELSQRLTDDLVSSIEEPVLGALIMGKAAEAHERGVELALNAAGSPAITGLAVQDLVAILGNLLDNAIDAAADAPAPKLVELTVEGVGGALEITVEDSGPGIDPEAVEDVFRHGFSTKTPGPFGRGLGLALVRQAVQRLGGTMTITSPAGALFRVTLPTAPPASAEAGTGTGPGPANTGGPRTTAERQNTVQPANTEGQQ